MNMTDEEIIAVAEATGLKLITLGLDKQKSEFLILAFAKQIAKLERYHEREVCALICDDHHHIWRFGEGEYSASGPKDCAAAIRARSGEQE